MENGSAKVTCRELAWELTLARNRPFSRLVADVVLPQVPAAGEALPKLSLRTHLVAFVCSETPGMPGLA